MFSTDVLGALAVLVGYAFAGRVLLSLLPPGLPGRHALRDLPSTWAASHLLGSAALLIERRVLEFFGIAPLPVVLLAPWLFLALARWLTLPGAIVPRHEPLSEPAGSAARLLTAAAPLLVLAGAVYAGSVPGSASAQILHIADALALLAFVAFALASTRRSSFGSSLALLGLAMVVAAALATSREEPIPLALSMGAGASLGVSWLRRGDRRAAAIAAIAFSSCALQGPREALFGVAGIFALWLHTPAPARPFLAILSAVLFPVCAVLGFIGSDLDSSAGPVISPVGAATLLVVAFALSARRRLVAARDRDREPDPAPNSLADGLVDSTRPQAAALRDTVLLCVIALASRSEFGSLEAVASALLPLSPLFAVEAGILLVRPANPLASRPSIRILPGSDRP